MKAQREESILRHLRSTELLTVEEASRLLGASEVTIRRDFRELARRGLVDRVHGGVRGTDGESMPSFRIREERHSIDKAAIARRAAVLIEPGDTLMIDGGTTTFHLHTLLPVAPLQVITNSLPLAGALEERRGRQMQPEILITGGVLYPESGLLVGPAVRRSLETYNARLTFLSVGGIDETGITNSNELVADVERAMIDGGDTVVVLADRSKLGRRSLSRVCGLDRIDILITRPAPGDARCLERIKNAGVEVIRV